MNGEEEEPTFNPPAGVLLLYVISLHCKIILDFTLTKISLFANILCVVVDRKLLLHSTWSIILRVRTNHQNDHNQSTAARERKHLPLRNVADFHQCIRSLSFSSHSAAYMRGSCAFFAGSQCKNDELDLLWKTTFVSLFLRYFSSLSRFTNSEFLLICSLKLTTRGCPLPTKANNSVECARNGVRAVQSTPWNISLFSYFM